MQQWQIQSDKTLKLVQAPQPETGPEDVLVEVKALGVNRADLLQVKGLYPAPAGFDSRVPGLEYAGVISQVGTRVQNRKIGDRVMGLIPSAAYSEFNVAFYTVYWMFSLAIVAVALVFVILKALFSNKEANTSS